MEMIPSALMIMFAVVASAVPWGLPGETTFILPFVTFLLVFLFAARPQQRVPVWLVFLAGLGTDVLTAGPLGYWAFIYTLGHTSSRILTRGQPFESLARLWLSFVPAAAAAAAAGWVLASLYYLRVIDWWPIALGTGCAIALFPLFAWRMRRSLAPGRYHGLAVGG